MSEDTMHQAKNTDRELWREREGDYYADSIHVTEQGGIGINCGGYVSVKPVRAWFDLARDNDRLRKWIEDYGETGAWPDEVARVLRGNAPPPSPIGDNEQSRDKEG